MEFGRFFLDFVILCSDFCICGTFVSLASKLRTSKSAAGLSYQSLCIVVGARSLHLLSHVLGLHYVPVVLPYFVYCIMDLVNAAAGITLLTVFVFHYFNTYEREKDDFGHHIVQKLGFASKDGSSNPKANSIFLLSCISILALVWYFVRRSNHTFLTSYFCCFYEVMGAVALIPQLLMFQKDKRVSPALANFVVLTAANRLCTLTFWIMYPWVYTWRYPDNRGIQMASEALNILILSDFLFYWVRSKVRGDAVVIIGDGVSDNV